jgi:hypothetical protein
MVKQVNDRTVLGGGVGTPALNHREPIRRRVGGVKQIFTDFRWGSLREAIRVAPRTI